MYATSLALLITHSCISGPDRPYGYISWQYEYDEDDHDHGEKTILGETGNWNGEDAVRIICSNKATAE